MHTYMYVYTNIVQGGVVPPQVLSSGEGAGTMLPKSYTLNPTHETLNP